MKSLGEVLREPLLLGESLDMIVHMKTISNESKWVHLTHSNMTFDDKECQILTIRDITAQNIVKKV